MATTVLVAAIVLIALVLRLRAALLLPVDFDEPTYLSIANQYASALQAGDGGATPLGSDEWS